MIIIDLIILICILLSLRIQAKKEAFKLALEKINMSNKLIEGLIDKRKELLLDICNNINQLQEDEVFLNLNKLNDDKDYFKIDRLITNYEYDLKEYLVINKNIILEDEINNKIMALKEIQNELNVLKMFFNESVDVFNLYVHKPFISKEKMEFKYPYSIRDDKMFKILNSN